MNCTVRGDIDACMKTPCSQHESWYAQTLKTQQRTWERPWASLTDEEIDYYIVHRCGVATKKNLVELIRLCEIKLKEKNT